jgi:hypothetical protein
MILSHLYSKVALTNKKALRRGDQEIWNHARSRRVEGTGDFGSREKKTWM